jgi:tRNA(fMet)-specific endonuclease VapC
VILDTSVLVTAERRNQTVGQIFAQFRTAFGEIEAGLSVVTVVELTHGLHRAKLDEQRHRRKVFLDDLLTDLSIYPVTTNIAKLAGRISGQEAEHGVNLPFEDLLIGATALDPGWPVVTHNVRHFQMIPNLAIAQL